MKQFPRHASVFSALLLSLSLLGCAPNKPFRDHGPHKEPVAYEHCKEEDRNIHPVCDETYYGSYTYKNKYKFDLAFVEYTERGAVFDQDRLTNVLEQVRDKARSGRGVNVVIFVHGWKNNAALGNGNVESFRDLLAVAAELSQNEERRKANARKASESLGFEVKERDARDLVGIYVGWRGSSLEADTFKELTYWDRKSVAEEVGKGGVTDLLLRLEQMLRDQDDPNKNTYLVTGHSLGAAVLLTGLNEIFLERVIDKTVPKSDEPQKSGPAACITTKPFGHSVALLNPAIEASEILQLKQLVANTCFEDNQERFMHIISSDADGATTWIFETAQWLGLVIGWNQASFDRIFQAYDDDNNVDENMTKTMTFNELDMDVTTVGNYEPFLTGYLSYKGSTAEKAFDHAKKDCFEKHEESDWKFVAFKRNLECFEAKYGHQEHVPISNNEPLVFIKTDEDFIGDHNDIFNRNVMAYLLAIIAESRSKRTHDKVQQLEKEIKKLNDAHPEENEAAEIMAQIKKKENHIKELWKILPEGPKNCYSAFSKEFDFGSCFQKYYEEICKDQTDKIIKDPNEQKHNACIALQENLS